MLILQIEINSPAFARAITQFHCFKTRRLLLADTVWSIKKPNLFRVAKTWKLSLESIEAYVSEIAKYFISKNADISALDVSKHSNV